MADYFFDSSAIVKRYIIETGSAFVDELIDPDEGNNIFIAEITRVEVASAFARREKGKTLAPPDAATTRAAFAKDVTDVYAIVAVTSELITHAADLATRHALRGYEMPSNSPPPSQRTEISRWRTQYPDIRLRRRRSESGGGRGRIDSGESE